MKVFQLNVGDKQSTIYCGDGCAESELPKMVSAYEGKMLFTDSNLYSLYREFIERLLPGAHICVMPAGEGNKTAEMLLQILSEMAKAKLNKKSVLIAFGGGVVGEIGGLAAGLYMRGIDCIQVPTSLLAQVDSAVGGKSAVDFAGVKNLVGIIRQPKYILVDGRFLNTLPAREIRCGLGEMIKHGALNGNLFDKLYMGDIFNFQFLSSLIPDNIALKASVVSQDEKESGLRKCLNLGHTTGHAIELSTNTLTHGECVLVGMIFELEIARRHVNCDKSYLDRLKALCMRALGGMPPLPDMREVAKLALFDKKNESNGKIIITAPAGRGQYALVELPFDLYTQELTRIACSPY